MIRNRVLALVPVLSATVLALLGSAGCGTPYEKGMAAYEKGQWKQAIEQFEDMDRWDPKTEEAEKLIAQACFHIGVAAMEQGRWDEALEYLPRAKTDEYELAKDMVGQAHFEKGREALERRDFPEALTNLLLVRPGCSKYERARQLAARARSEQQG